jgi:hypothetical protein
VTGVQTCALPILIFLGDVGKNPPDKPGFPFFCCIRAAGALEQY